MNSEHITDIEQELIDIAKAIREEGDEFKQLAIDAGEKRRTFDKLKYDETLLLIDDPRKLTLPDKEAIIKAKFSDIYFEARTAQTLLEATEGRLNALKSQLSAIQTRAGLIKTERSLVSYN